MAKTPRRKVLRDFQILEISAVTKPAQAPALAAITKVDDQDLENGGRSMSDAPKVEGKVLVDGLAKRLVKMYVNPSDGPVSFATVISEDLKQRSFYDECEKYYPYLNALETSVRSIAGDASIDPDQRYTMIRNQVEGFMSVLKDLWVNVDEALVPYADFEEEVTVTEKVEKTSEEKAQIEELTKKLEAAEKQIATLKAEADLTKDEADFYKSLNAEGKEAFIAMNKAERRAELSKLSDDETVVIEGRTVRKSVIGEDTFAILKAQSDRMEKAEMLAKEERERRELAEFTKAADENYNTLPGTALEKAKALAELSKCSAETQDTVEKMLKAGASGNADAFKDLGHDGKTEKKADGGHAFLAKVDEIATAQKLNRADAMAKARKQFPDEFQAYRESEAA